MEKIKQKPSESFMDLFKRLNKSNKSIVEVIGNIENKIDITGKIIINPFEASKILDVPSFLVKTFIPFSIKEKCLVFQAGINKDNTFFIINGYQLNKLTKEEVMLKLLNVVIPAHNRLEMLYLGEKIAARKVIVKKIHNCDCWMDAPIK